MKCENIFYLGLISKFISLRQLDQLQARLLVAGFLHSDLLLATKLTDKLADLGAIHRAHQTFSSLPRHDLFLYNVLIRGFSRNGSPRNAVSLYLRLRRATTLRPDNFTYAFAVSASASLGSSRIGRLLHAHSVVDGFHLDLFVASNLLGFYLKFSQVDNAQKVFDGMAEPDTVAWNAFISGLAQNGCLLKSLQTFARMVHCDARFDSTTLAVALPAAAELQDLSLGREIHCLGTKRGLDQHSFVVTGLISVYSKCGELHVAKSIFGLVAEPDLIAWNAMISGCTFDGEIEASVDLFKGLQNSGLMPNSITLVGLIPVSFPSGHLHLTSSIHGYCMKAAFNLNPLVATALVTVYARLNEMESARRLFDEMPVKCLASWNAMISGYSQNGLTERAIELFQQMQMWDIRPNPLTVASTLSACAQFGAFSLGKSIHEMVIAEQFEPNVYISTALIDMYAKCGAIEEARRVFDAMHEKNIISWNAIISGYGLHGQGRESLKLFQDMLSLKLKPTGVTFLSVLYACSHAGLVEEGQMIFQTMTSDYGTRPGPEHYACMVDLLGRAGELEKALDFIVKMPVEPIAGVWGALLAACMKHKNSSLARLASDNLFKLEPESAGYYVLLSNIYSADRNYGEAAKIRQLVQNRNLAKTPGYSLIEVGKRLHVFTSGDTSHARSSEIYVELEALIGKMREAGFQTEIDAALYDVEEEEKENMIKVHSEKLAITFGLISTEPGTEIRIMKNLRVCLDCHNAIKFISKITEREIIVRDASRFHHFRNGSCSCGDYW